MTTNTDNRRLLEMDAAIERGMSDVEAGRTVRAGDVLKRLEDKYKEMAEPAVRRLTPEEIAELRRDMAEASAWARAELARRRNDKKL
ncbi:hypothetical protein [Halomonas sp. SpR8]|uniref:hypothetical protein n=1 Tax=Halomonas sp. SpR8 TaxID=3050463 RepID=UPI0027E5AE01|nr:hypothetical protein [Halomonas sp. SpR8]MDQ7731045.1 hypothetical protein [Halomonas sp. SpR8]